MNDQDLLKEIRERYTYAETEWQKIREEGDTDMRYIAGDPWEPKDRKAREDAGRPCLSLDELGQYTNSVINNFRANPRAMKFAPTGDGANDEGAKFYADKARETEYRSHAQLAYTTAAQNMVERSFGWVRVTTKHETDRSFNQDLWIGDIPNPNMVLPDPESKRPDSSDLRFLFYVEDWAVSEFKRQFKDATIQDFTPALRDLAPSWINGSRERVKVAEYWTKEVARQRRLLLLKPGRGSNQPIEVFEDELPGKKAASDQVLRERKVDEYKVTQYLTNGVEILKTTPWLGKYIPFASCFGKVIYVDEGSGPKRRILSMTRLARDPYMLYCYYRTCEAELVGMTPKFPYFAYEGQLSPEQLLNLQKSLHEPVAVILVKPIVDGATQQVLGIPQRQPYEPPIQGLEMGAEAARRSIQAAAMGSPLPTQAQRHNEKSGVALQQIEKSGQVGNYHFADHFDDMIRHVGVIFEDLLPHILDSARNTGVQDAQGKAKTVRINDPKPTPDQFQQNPAQLQGALQAWQARQPPGSEDSISTKGDYLVTVSSGPAADSQREAISEFVQGLMNIPIVAQSCADLVVKLQGSTMGFGQLNPLLEELADRLTPPQFKKPKPGEGPDPQQMQQQLAQGQQEAQQLKGMVQKLTQEITTKKAETDSRERIAAAEIQSKERIAEVESRRRAATALAVARISAAKAALDSVREGQEEAIALDRELQADATTQLHDHAHDVGMAALDHANTLEQGQQAHDQALEQGDQGVAGQIAVQAAAPKPESPAAGA